MSSHPDAILVHIEDLYQTQGALIEDIYIPPCFRVLLVAVHRRNPQIRLKILHLLHLRIFTYVRGNHIIQAVAFLRLIHLHIQLPAHLPRFTVKVQRTEPAGKHPPACLTVFHRSPRRLSIKKKAYALVFRTVGELSHNVDVFISVQKIFQPVLFADEGQTASDKVQFFFRYS